MKILALVPYPSEGASNRIRVEQYIPYLKSRGAALRIRPFINRPFYKIIYLPRRYLTKIMWFIICTVNRILDLARALRYDIIFIHREAYPFGGAVVELILQAMRKPIVFDFDDSIFLANSSEHNVYIERLKRPEKVAAIIRMSDHIIAGNNFLKTYADRYNRYVSVIPSVIDTDKYLPLPQRESSDHVVIGWIGSNTTSNFLYAVEGVIARLSERYGNIMMKVIGANFYSSVLQGIIINKRWRLEDEIEDLRSLDIGIMPMSENDWTRGKCGFKAILYMACAIPVVVSPVGVNSEIITDGVNGYLAANDEEWEAKLSSLIEDRYLRMKMGERGRETIAASYSLNVMAPVFYDILKGTYDRSNAGRRNADA